MANKAIVDYLRENEKKGHSIGDLASHLLSQGQDSDDIQEAISELNFEKNRKRLDELNKKPNNLALITGIGHISVILLMFFINTIASNNPSMLLVNALFVLAIVIIWLFGVYLVYFETELKEKSMAFTLFPLFFGGLGLVVYYYLNYVSLKKKAVLKE